MFLGPDVPTPRWPVVVFIAALLIAWAPQNLSAQESPAADPDEQEQGEDTSEEPEPEKNLRFSIIGGPFYNVIGEPPGHDAQATIDP